MSLTNIRLGSNGRITSVYLNRFNSLFIVKSMLMSSSPLLKFPIPTVTKLKIGHIHY